jgi:hydroxymethylpyrimidine pyrophosphatase-like HAD family hydrolase
MTHVFVFDIDNTLTPPREPLGADMAALLERLPHPFALAAGSDAPLLREQFFEPLHAFGYKGSFDAFICNGASRYHCVYADTLTITAVDEFSLRSHLGDADFAALHALLNEALAAEGFALPEGFPVVGERLIDRGSMINLAPSGRQKGSLSKEARISRDRFVELDEQTGYRKRGLPALKARIDQRLPGRNIVVTLGGQTSFDIVVRGRDKSFAVRSLLEAGHSHVTYVGDALFPGGNDAAVLDFAATWPGGSDVIDVVQVDGWQDTARLLERAIAGG